jgi:hypothetical protein
VTDGWREPFEQALDADPSDHRVRRDLADHLAERGEPDAEPVRWLADHGKWPLRGDGPGGSARWDWYTVSRPEHCRAPGPVFYLLAGPAIYPTRRAAEADFCRAYHAARAAGWGPTSA